MQRQKLFFSVLGLAITVLIVSVSVLHFYSSEGTTNDNRVENIETIWTRNCSSGIFFNGKCICPAGFTGDKCETDQCSSIVDYHLYQPFTNRSISKFEKCPYPPAAIHCNRKALLSHNRVKQVTINDFDNSADQLAYIFEYYGPWSADDKLFFHYLFRPQDFDVSLNVSNSENSLAFVFMLHKDPTLFGLLWPFIYRPHHQYIIHFDLKMKPEYMARVHEIVKNNSGNVEIMRERFSGNWGEISLVYIEMAAISRLLHTQKTWSHVINLSGDDFLIKPIEHIERELSLYKKISFIEFNITTFDSIRISDTWINCPKLGSRDTNARMESWFVDRPSEPSSLNYARQRLSSTNIQLKGTQWHILSREAAEIATKNLKALELLLSMKFTLIPDEYFFPVFAKTMKLPIVNNDKRWINWLNKLKVEEKDIPILKASDRFISRKVEVAFVPTLVQNLLK